MGDLIKSLNYSLDDFESFNSIELFIESARKKGVKSNALSVELGDQFKRYGRMLRSSMPAAVLKAYESLLVTYYKEVRNDVFDLVITKLIGEIYLKNQPNPSFYFREMHKTILSIFEILAKKVNSINDESFSSDREFVNYFFMSIFIGKKVYAHRDVGELTKEEVATCDLIQKMQISRVIWKLETVSAVSNDLEDSSRISALLTIAYDLIGIKGVNITVNESLFDESERFYEGEDEKYLGMSGTQAIEVLKILNVSIEEFEDFPTLESFLNGFKNCEDLVDDWIKPFGELFLSYGTMKRVLKITDNSMVFGSLLKAFYGMFKKGDFDLAMTKQVGEKFLTAELNSSVMESHSNVLSVFKKRRAEVNSVTARALNGNDRKFMNNFFKSILVGKKAKFLQNIKFITEREWKAMKLVANVQLLRAIWKLEDRLTDVGTIKESKNVYSTLSNFYDLIGLENAKVADNELKEMNADILALSFDELDDEMMKKQMMEIVKTLNFSFDDFDDLTQVNLFLAAIEDCKLEIEDWIKPFGDELLQYGKLKRVLKETDEVKLNKNLFELYHREIKERNFDLKTVEFLARNFMKDSSDDVFVAFDEQTKIVELFEEEIFDGDDQKYLKYFCAAMFVGKKVKFYHQVKTITKSDFTDVKLIGHLQILRVIRKLEDLLSTTSNYFESSRIFFPLIRAYARIGIESSEVARNPDEADWIAETDETIDEDELFEKIEKGMRNSRDLKLSTNMTEVLKEMNLSPLKYETEVLTNRFLNSRLQNWKSFSLKAIKTFIENSNKKALQNFLNFFGNNFKLLEVPMEIHNLDRQILLQNYELINTKDEFEVVKDLYNFAFDLASEKSKVIALESKLWTTLMEILRNAYEDFEEICSKLQLADLKNEESHFRKLLAAIKQADLNVAQFKLLKETADELWEIDSSPMFTGNLTLLADYAKPLKIDTKREGNKKSMEIFGSHVRVAKVLDQIKANVGDLQEIRFLGIDVLHVDVNFAQNIFHGKNLFVLANLVKVHGNVEWDVSGNDSANKYSSNAQQNSDGNGNDGNDGNAGESGGNFFLFCNEIVNASNWSVKSNGGRGSAGQDGGDGRNGIDGETFTLSDIVRINHHKFGTQISSVVQETGNHSVDQYITYWSYQYQNDRGSVLTYYSDDERKFKIFKGNTQRIYSLLLVEGVNGTIGKNGGRLGLGGEGGHPGELKFSKVDSKSEYTNVKTESRRGEFGRDGHGGFYGKQGANGSDAGVFRNVTDGKKKEEIVFESRGTQKYKIFFERGPGDIVKPYGGRVSIKVIEQGRTPVSNYQTRNFETVTRHRQNQAVATQRSPVLWQSLLDKYSGTLNVQLSIADKTELEMKDVDHIKFEDKATMKVQRNVASDINLEANETAEKEFRAKLVMKKSASLNETLKFIDGETNFEKVLLAVRNIELDKRQLVDEIMTFMKQRISSLVPNDGKKSQGNATTALYEVVEKVVSSYNGNNFSSLIGKCYQKFKQFEETRNEIYLEAFERELSASLPNSLELYEKSQTQDWAEQKFKSEIKDKRLLSFLYKQLEKRKKFDWKQCVEGTEIRKEVFKFLIHNSSTYDSQKYFVNLSKAENIDIMNKLLLEKYKSAAMAEVAESLRDSTIEKLPDLSDYEIMNFLTIPYSFKTDLSHGSLGRFDAFFSGNRKEQNEILIGHVQDLLNSVEKTYPTLLEPFAKFLEEKIKSSDEADKKSLTTWENLQQDLFRFSIPDNFLDKIESDFDVEQMPEKISAQVNRFEQKIGDKLTSLLLKKSFENKFIREAFLKTVLDGVGSPVVLSLLAQAFSIKIALYKEVDGSMGFAGILNASNESLSKIRIFASDDGDYFTIIEDEKKIKLHQQELAKDLSCQRVANDFRLMKTKIEIDKYLKDKNYLKTSESSQDSYLQGFSTEDDQIIDDITNYFSTSTENEQQNLKFQLQKVSSIVLQNSRLLKAVIVKFHNDGAFLSLKEFAAILDVVITFIADDKPFVDTFAWIFLSRMQSKWLPSLIMMQIEDVVDEVEESWKNEYLEKLSGFEIRNAIILLSEKLQDKKDDLKLETISDIIDAFNTFTIDTFNFLEASALSSWKFMITNQYWSARVSKLFDDDEKKVDKIGSIATFHLCNLQVQFNTNLVRKLMNIFEAMPEVSDSNFLLILTALSNNEVALSESVLEDLKKMSLNDWLRKHKLEGMSSKDQRHINELIAMITNGLNAETSSETIKELEEIKKLVDGLFDRTCGAMYKQIKNFSEAEVKYWRRNIFKLSTDPVEALAVIVRAFQIVTKGLTLRYAQLLSILLFWRTKKPLLSQISTGEGKSWIAVTFSAMKVLYGQRVDIITSSNLLATRDAIDEKNNKVFGMLGISVGHNCDDDTESRTAVYANKDVIYGSLGNFQRDFLLDKFYDKNITAGRKRSNVIVDEIDCMLLDKGLMNKIFKIKRFQRFFISRQQYFVPFPRSARHAGD